MGCSIKLVLLDSNLTKQYLNSSLDILKLMDSIMPFYESLYNLGFKTNICGFLGNLKRKMKKRERSHERGGGVATRR